MFKKILIVMAIVLVSSCGGGGGSGSTPTDPNTVFNSFPPNKFVDGYIKTINYTGTDNNGDKYTATLSSKTQAKTTFLNQPAIPIFVQIQMTDTNTGASIPGIETDYFSTSASDRRFLGSKDSTTTTVSATTKAIPQTVKIGNFDTIGTYTDNAGNVIEQSWRLDGAGNGNAKIVILEIDKDASGNTTSTTTTTNTIDTSGNSISQMVVVFFASDGLTITLNGS